jgi:hypothetical protein
MKRILNQRDRPFIAVFGLVGVMVTGAYLMYLAITVPHWQQRSPKIRALFDGLCPFGFLNAIFIDSAPSTRDSAILWIVVSILNAGLYGLIGFTVARLAKRNQRKWSRAGLIASLAAIVVGMTVGMSLWRLILFEIGVGCAIAVWQYDRLATTPDSGRPGDNRL